MRVRQSPSDHEYEDIQEKVKNPQQSPTVKTSKGSSPRQNEKESDANRFKSILKKPTTFSDTDTNYGTERSPSPAQKTGSHFYLPAPRKKVQFLVECRKEEREEQDESPKREKPTQLYENVPEKEEVKKQEEEEVDKSGEESSGNSSEDGKDFNQIYHVKTNTIKVN